MYKIFLLIMTLGLICCKSATHTPQRNIGSGNAGGNKGGPSGQNITGQGPGPIIINPPKITPKDEVKVEDNINNYFQKIQNSSDVNEIAKIEKELFDYSLEESTKNKDLGLKIAQELFSNHDIRDLKKIDTEYSIPLAGYQLNHQGNDSYNFINTNMWIKNFAGINDFLKLNKAGFDPLFNPFNKIEYFPYIRKDGSEASLFFILLEEGVIEESNWEDFVELTLNQPEFKNVDIKHWQKFLNHEFEDKSGKKESVLALFANKITDGNKQKAKDLLHYGKKSIETELYSHYIDINSKSPHAKDLLYEFAVDESIKDKDNALVIAKFLYENYTKGRLSKKDIITKYIDELKSKRLEVYLYINNKLYTEMSDTEIYRLEAIGFNPIYSKNNDYNFFENRLADKGTLLYVLIKDSSSEAFIKSEGFLRPIANTLKKLDEFKNAPDKWLDYLSSKGRNYNGEEESLIKAIKARFLGISNEKIKELLLISDDELNKLLNQ